VLSGPLFDRGYFRSMLFAGNFLIVLGIMMLSLSTTYWQVFLSQGLCMGLGAGLLYIPSLAMVGVWFDKKRNLAMGIVMSGIAIGMFHRLPFVRSLFLFFSSQLKTQGKSMKEKKKVMIKLKELHN
jgi:MFS family permease